MLIGIPATLVPHGKKLRMASVVLLTLCASLLGCRGLPKHNEPVPVLMVCEHGSVKSLMAASLFNQAATQRGLPFRATARGVSPDAKVPERIASALGKEGFEISGFVPTKFSEVDLERSRRVILIGLDPKILNGEASGKIETWLDVPAAGTDYEAARASLAKHIETLLDELATGKLPVNSSVVR
jgi:arsenate reductase (thioredoxin)